MRRTTLLLTAMVLTSLLLASGVALAVNRTGTPGHDRMIGTTGPDNLDGRSGDDFIDGRRGADNLAGSAGNDDIIDGPLREFAGDVLRGGAGHDLFFVQNRPAARDIVGCGAGFDDVIADRKDLVGDDCERVQRIS